MRPRGNRERCVICEGKLSKTKERRNDIRGMKPDFVGFFFSFFSYSFHDVMLDARLNFAQETQAVTPGGRDGNHNSGATAGDSTGRPRGATAEGLVDSGGKGWREELKKGGHRGVIRIS